MSMYCKNCGTEIDTRYPFPDGSVQCPQCGMIYRPANYQPAQPQYQQPQFQPTNSQNAQTERQPRRRRADMYGDQQDAPQEPEQPQYQQSTGQQFRQPLTPTYQQPVQQQSASVQIAKKSPLGKIIIAAATILIAVILSVVLLGNRSPYAKQYALIAKFEKAYNNQDYYAMIDCFEPQVKQLLGGLMSLNGAMNGTNYSSSMMDILPYASKALGASGVMEGNFGKVKFTPYSCKVNGTDAVVGYHVEHTINGGTQKYDEAAQLVQVNGEWYFSSVQADQNALLSQVEEERPPAHLDQDAQSEDMFEDANMYLDTFEEAKAAGGFFCIQNDRYLQLNSQNSSRAIQRGPSYGMIVQSYPLLFQLSETTTYPVISRTDKIIYISPTDVASLYLQPISESGYTPGLFLGQGICDLDDLLKKHGRLDTHSSMAKDYPGAVINNGQYTTKDFRNGVLPLPKGEELTLNWYEGTEYKETKKKANYRYHIIDQDKIVLSGTLTQNGYAEYDISNVQDGLYVLQSGQKGDEIMGIYWIGSEGQT